MKINKIMVLIVMVLAILVTAQSALADVYINEFVSHPADGEVEWIELYNDNETDSVNLTGWSIEDGTGVVGNTLLDGLEVPANGYLVINDTLLNFELNNGGDIIVLTNDDLEIVDEVTFGDFDDGNILDNELVLNQGESLARLYNGIEEWVIMEDPTPGVINNNLPAGEVPGVNFQEGVDITKIINLSEYITDADNDSLTFTPTVNPENVNDITCVLNINGEELEISLKEGWTNHQTICNIEANDDYETESFNVTVDINGAITIDLESVEVLVGDSTKGANISKEINVSSGQDVSVSFEYTNNIDEVIGHVDITAIDNNGGDIVNYTNHQWVLLGTASDEFEFLVPWNVDDTFSINLTVLDEDEEGNVYFDEIYLDFNVLKKGQDILIESVELDDSDLTCTRITNLAVNLSNVGEYTSVPELRIFSQEVVPATSDDDELVFVDNGENVVSPIYIYDGYELGTSISSEESELLEFNVNFTDLDNGMDQKLYVYAVSPFFYDELGFYNADMMEVDFNISTCLNVTNLESFAQSYREDVTGFNFLDYEFFSLEDDPAEDYSLSFEVINQTNEELLFCEFDGVDDVCNIVKDNDWGTSEITLQISEGTTGSVIEETFNVEILPTLEIEDVVIENGKDEISNEGETLEIKPFETLTAEFKLQNYLSEKIHDVNLVFTGDEIFSFATDDVSIDKIEGEEDTTSLTLTKEIPYNVPIGIYEVSLDVSGIYTEDDDIKKDFFNFLLNVNPGSDGLEISGLSWDGLEENMTYCNQKPTLKITLENGGQFTEDDINIQVKDKDGIVLYNLFEETGDYGSLNAGDSGLFDSLIDTSNFSIDVHNLTVEVSYNTDTDSATPRKIEFTKNGCVNIPELTMTEDNSTELSVNLNEHLVKEGGEDVTFEFNSNSNDELIECEGDDVTGEFSCDAIKEIAQELNNGETNSTELNVTITAVDGTENEHLMTVVVTGINDLVEIIETDFETTENTTYEFLLEDVVSDVDNELTSLTFNENSGNIKSIVANDDGKLIITPENENWNTESMDDLVEIFNLTVSDGINETTEEVSLKVTNDQADSASLSGKYPVEDKITVLDNVLQLMNITIENSDNVDVTVKWFVDDIEVDGFGEDSVQYNFNQVELKDYVINATLFNGETILGTETWTITVIGQPLAEGFETNLNETLTDDELKDFSGLILENSHGEIKFTGSIDLTNIFDFNEFVIINQDQAGINTSAAPDFNVPATITLKNFVSNDKTVIFKYTGYGDDLGDKTICSDCVVVSDEDSYLFNVTGFSTYKVVNGVESDLGVSDLTIGDKVQGDNVSVNIPIKNVGTLDDLTDVNVKLVGFASKYNPEISLTDTSLKAGETVNAKLDFSIPDNEDTGKQSIGTINVTGEVGNETVSAELTVYLDIKSSLGIEYVKINGKTSGDLSVEEDNEIKIKVQNDYTEDLEDVVITATLLDVDDNDLEEESEEFDLDKGDDETITLEFDLADEDLDEDSYTLKVVVEGQGDDDGSEHETTFELEVDVDRESHKLIVKRTTLSATTLQCLRQATVTVDVENVGKKDEDDVTVRLINYALSLDETTTPFKVDKYSDKDNDHKSRFYLDLEGTEAGTYPLTVELYRDGDLEESEELTLNVLECVTTSTTTQNQQVASTPNDMAAKMQDGMADYLKAKQTEQKESTPTSAFRESGTYTTLLIVLVVLIFITMMLGMAVAFKKKR